MFARVTQRRQMDLEFLKRLAREHNFDFTVRAGQLIFYERPALESVAAATLITRSDTIRFSFRNRARRIYDAAKFSYFDPDTKDTDYSVGAGGRPSPTGDTLKIVARCETARASAGAKPKPRFICTTWCWWMLRLKGRGTRCWWQGTMCSSAVGARSMENI